jgi:hypothetical protein
MKKNFLYEAYHYSLHLIKLFFGIDSYYAMRNHHRSKLKDRMLKFNDSNHRSIDENDSDTRKKSKFPFPPHTHS